MRDGVYTPGDFFHTGVIVLDLDAAVPDVSAAMGVEFTPLVEYSFQMWRPHGIDQIDMRVRYSTGTPPYIELIETIPGTIFEAVGGVSHLHHLGVWVEDIDAESARLEALGMPRTAALIPEGGPTSLAFHESPHGTRLELCGSHMRPAFQSWIAGGDFPA